MTAQPNTPKPAWQAGRTVSTEEVAQWLRAEGFIISGTVKPVAEGFDNFIFEADGLYIRATRRLEAAPDIHKEVRLLSLLARALPVWVPEPVLVPSGLASMQWPWFAFKPVDGQESVEALIAGRDLRNVAVVLGKTLRRLHFLDQRTEISGWVREDTFRRTDMPYRIAKCRDHLRSLERLDPGLPFGALSRALDDASSLGVLPCVALVHGDLHMRHLMLGDHDQLVGLIDWGDAHIGHPACDFYAYWSLFRPDERSLFLETYGGATEETLKAGRVVAIYINAVLALSADDFGLPRLRIAALEALRRTAGAFTNP